jgi:pyrrolysine biosynthesis protein PylD
MTRLTPDDVAGIPRGIAAHDRELKETVGGSLMDIARLASGHGGDLRAALKGQRCIAIPITSGRGVILGFSEAVAAILSHLGMDASVSPEPDVGGFTHALREGCMAFAADDEVFAGMNLRTGALTLNHDATGRAYAAALEIRAGGLEGKPVALVGAGKVGASATTYLCARGAKVFAYDIAAGKAQALARAFPEKVRPCASMGECLGKARLVLLAAPGRGFIPARMVRGRVFSAPAVPVGLSKSAYDELGENCLIHDPIEIGVAAMAADLVK